MYAQGNELKSYIFNAWKLLVPVSIITAEEQDISAPYGSLTSNCITLSRTTGVCPVALCCSMLCFFCLESAACFICRAPRTKVEKLVRILGALAQADRGCGLPREAGARGVPDAARAPRDVTRRDLSWRATCCCCAPTRGTIRCDAMRCESL